MEKQLISIIIEHADKPLKEQKGILEDRLSDWMNGYKQIDDISIMAFKV